MTSAEDHEHGIPVDATERESALIELIRLDYESTTGALNGFVSVGNQMRSIGIGAWGVLLGLAVSAESAAQALLAIGVLAVFASSDAYHAALCRRALGRAIALEGLIDGWVDRLGIDADDPVAIARIRARLEMHRFGVQRGLKRPTWRDLFAARPYVVFRIVYPVLAITSIATAAAYA